jgi:endonuclease YncB( thermonuclease family)
MKKAITAAGTSHARHIRAEEETILPYRGPERRNCCALMGLLDRSRLELNRTGLGCLLVCPCRWQSCLETVAWLACSLVRFQLSPRAGARAQAIELGRRAKIFTASALAQPFTIYTRWRKVFGPTRYYAIVVTPGGRDLNELLVGSGLARIYGTRTPLPDGRDSRKYLAHLHALENEAKAAKRGGWGMVQP